MAASLVFRLHDGGPELVRDVLLERGWEEYDEEERGEEDWNLYWRGSAFCNSEYDNLLPWQRLNHHPKTAGITRKDYLARNLRRMRATFGSAYYDFSPTVFVLPSDFTRFLAEHNKRRRTGGPPVYWIRKPVALSRGRGIFIFEDVKDLVYGCPVIVQRYVSDPLLISGYKFDLRIYACVKSFHPLTVYLHQEGLVRFATEKYSLSCLQNLYSHLTNTSINKLGPFYKTTKDRVGQGCKWTLSKFRHFLRSQNVDEILLWQRINNIVTLTLLAIAPSVPSCPNCVELLGFDILVDVSFKPWLLEVNYSPALSLDCQADIAVKKGLVGDLIDLMNYTLMDSWRERAYQRVEHKRPRLHANLPSRVAPVPSRFQESSKTLHLPPNVTRKQSRPSARVTGHRGHLPPLRFNKMLAARPRIMNTTATHGTLNLTLSSWRRTNEPPANRRTRPGGGGLRGSEVSRHDAAETGAEVELSGERGVSSLTCDVPPARLRFRCFSPSQKLPKIQRPGRIPLEGNAALTVQHVPPVRVGDFIRTFPFNAATLKASQHRLDVKTVVRELHQLTGQLACPDERLVGDGGENFESLLWGPKDPPLLSHCVRPR